ncbi:hypothetical protein A3762_09930 [Oleiphilus sp. HI0125]|nr:hypothetical protein A3762_09930 [Oleiphilus sp. HI0125]
MHIEDNKVDVPEVSVLVHTFNQSEYIEQCLDSVCSQNTTFKYEVIVHDDCSTDDTTEILLAYKEQYPEKIRLVIQEQNKRSQGHRVISLSLPHAEGDYVAICEGDDYWIDEHKLQKQYDALQRHPNVDLCFHPAKQYRNKKFHSIINEYYSEETVIPFENVVEGRGGYMPTASLFIRKSSIYPFRDWFIERAPVGDTFIQALGSSRGGALFLSDSMSVYNRYSIGSATAGNLRKRSLEQIANQAENYRDCYNQLSVGLSESEKMSCRIALSQLIFDLSVKALDDGYIDLFKSLFDRAWPDKHKKSAFVYIVWLARYIHFCRPIVRKKLAHKRNLVVT